jgi:hypothetical protein
MPGVWEQGARENVSNGEKVTEGPRKLNNEEFHNWYAYSLPYISKWWMENIARGGEMRNTYKVPVGKFQGEENNWNIRRRREHNIKIDL